MKDFCCEDMKFHVYLVNEDAILDDGDKEDKVVFYYSEYDEYGIPVADLVDGFVSSSITIKHCPWCGKKLPESKSEEWFERLWALGYDSPMEDDIPTEFKTSEWYTE